MRIGITERGDGGLEIQTVLKALREKKVDGAIVITKFSHLLIPFQNTLPSNLIIHCTITGMGGNPIEPNVSPWRDSAACYQQLVKWYGPERVVLRVDPVVPTDEYGIAATVIGEQCSRVRISFLDMYAHVKSRLTKCMSMNDIDFFYQGALHAPLKLRQNYLTALQTITSDIEVCGEPGLPCVGCVSARDIKAMGLQVPDKTKEGRIRSGCKCLTMKTELLNNRHPCAAKCLYCYWKD